LRIEKKGLITLSDIGTVPGAIPSFWKIDVISSINSLTVSGEIIGLLTKADIIRDLC